MTKTERSRQQRRSEEKKKKMLQRQLSSRPSIFIRCKKAISIGWKKLSQSFKIVFSATIAVVGIYLILDYSYDQKIQASIYLKGDLSFSLNDHQENLNSTYKISLLAGNFLRAPYRGLQFFSKNINYEIIDTTYAKDDSLHQYLFFSPAGHMGFSGKFEFGFKAFLVKNESVQGDTTRPIIDLPNAELISLFTKSNHLDINTSDSFPIAALLPARNSKVVVTRHHDSYRREDIGFSIDEEFKISGDTSNWWETPTLDIFGPKVIVRSKAGSIKYNQQLYQLSESDTGYSAILVFNVVPQLRLIHMKVDSSLFDNMKHPKNAIVYHDSYGRLSLSTYSLSSEEFDSVKSLIKRISIIHIPFDHFREREWKQQAYIDLNNPGAAALPPVYNCNGLYLYTNYLSNLRSSETLGNIQYGSEPHPLNGHNTVDFRKLENFELYNQPIILPLEQDSLNESLVKFKADGKLYVDNEKVRFTGFDSKLIQKVLLIISIITGLASLLFLVRDINKWASIKIQQVNEPSAK